MLDYIYTGTSLLKNDNNVNYSFNNKISNNYNTQVTSVTHK